MAGRVPMAVVGIVEGFAVLAVAGEERWIEVEDLVAERLALGAKCLPHQIEIAPCTGGRGLRVSETVECEQHAVVSKPDLRSHVAEERIHRRERIVHARLVAHGGRVSKVDRRRRG